jgi:hypothetical protein
MTSIERRIEKLEKRWMPAPQTAYIRELIPRLESGRQRAHDYCVANGIPESSDEGLPPKKVHKSHGIQLIMDRFNEGRERSALRNIRDEELRESIPPAATP